MNKIKFGLNNDENENINLINKDEKEKEEFKLNTAIEFAVNLFTIQLNKNDKTQLARFDCKNLAAFIESTPERLKTKGRLGELSIHDICEKYSAYYPERFLTSGQQALDFEFTKYSLPAKQQILKPINNNDDELFSNSSSGTKQRDFDHAFRLRMSSVKYIHTQRFIISLTNYFQQFNQLQDALGRMRALAQGNINVSYMQRRGARIKLDIQAKTPIIIIPISSQSSEALVLNLGNIKVENNFIFAKQKDSIHSDKLNSKLNQQQQRKKSTEQDYDLIEDLGPVCLLDSIRIQFKEADIYSARRYNRSLNVKKEEEEEEKINKTKDLSIITFNSFKFIEKPGKILKNKTNLFIKIERNLDGELSHSSPDFSMHLILSSVEFRLNLNQYTLVKGVLDQNIGEPINEIVQSVFLIPNTKIDTVLTGKVNFKLLSRKKN